MDGQDRMKRCEDCGYVNSLNEEGEYGRWKPRLRCKRCKTPFAESANNIHNPEETYTRAGVGKEMKPVVVPPRDEELSRVGGRIPTLTSPVTPSKQNTNRSEDGN